MTQSLASLLKAGLVLDRALHLIGDTSDRPAIRELCLDLERRVRAGSSFGDALREHHKLFPPYYIAMARAGELGGSLPEGLERLASFAERAASVRERIVSSLIYPCMLAGMILLTVVLVLTVVLPPFSDTLSRIPGAAAFANPSSARAWRFCRRLRLALRRRHRGGRYRSPSTVERSDSGAKTVARAP